MPRVKHPPFVDNAADVVPGFHTTWVGFDRLCAGDPIPVLEGPPIGSIFFVALLLSAQATGRVVEVEVHKHGYCQATKRSLERPLWAI